MIPFAATFPLDDVWIFVVLFGTMGLGLLFLWLIGQLNYDYIRLKILPFAVLGGVGAAVTEDPVEEWYESRYSVCVEVAPPAELGAMAGLELSASCYESSSHCSCSYTVQDGTTAGRIEIDGMVWGEASLFEQQVRKAPAAWTGVPLPSLPYAHSVQLYETPVSYTLYVELRGGGLLELHMPPGVRDEDAVALVHTVVGRKLAWTELTR